MSEFHACTPYNYYPGKLYLTEKNKITYSCHEDVNIDYKDADFHNFQIIDILKGRSNQIISNIRKMNTNENSKIVIIITSHGGENFIKIRNRSVILSDELNRALNEMYLKGRYKEILFILDTCEGFSLFEYVNAPNIYFVTSSIKHQKALSHSFDELVMTPTSDRFHFKLHEILQDIHKKKNFKYSIKEMFKEMQKLKSFFESDIAIQDEIKRDIIFEEFFGNYLTKNHLNKKYDYTINTIINNKNLIINQPRLDEIALKVDEHILNIKKYNQIENKITNKSEGTSESIYIINSFCLFVLIYLIYNLFI
jgi:phosphatidylinositol glycan class K